MDGGDKYGVTANSVHVDARAGLQVVQVDVAKFGDEVDGIIFCTSLLQNEQYNDYITLVYRY